MLRGLNQIGVGEVRVSAMLIYVIRPTLIISFSSILSLAILIPYRSIPLFGV